MTPLIAVPGRRSEKAQGVRTAAVAAGRPYLEALRRAGAEGAVLLPDAGAADRLAGLLGRFDGLLLLGGGDLDPATFGALTCHDTVYGVDPHHDAFELAAARTAVALDVPVLAICRGLQVLNVAQGGTLHQHITDGETTVAHREAMHSTTLAAGSRVAAAMGTLEPVGWSHHHQAVDQVGRGLVVTGRAADGTIEAVELPERRWVVGVQWHPENTAAQDSIQQRLFDAFVTACAARPAPVREAAGHAGPPA